MVSVHKIQNNSENKNGNIGWLPNGGGNVGFDQIFFFLFILVPGPLYPKFSTAHILVAYIYK
jgi:hypothetical protein